jgi:hypothetical protein
MLKGPGKHRFMKKTCSRKYNVRLPLKEYLVISGKDELRERTSLKIQNTPNLIFLREFDLTSYRGYLGLKSVIFKLSGRWVAEWEMGG